MLFRSATSRLIFSQFGKRSISTFKPSDGYRPERNAIPSRTPSTMPSPKSGAATTCRSTQAANTVTKMCKVVLKKLNGDKSKLAIRSIRYWIHHVQIAPTKPAPITSAVAVE